MKNRLFKLILFLALVMAMSSFVSAFALDTAKGFIKTKNGTLVDNTGKAVKIKSISIADTSQIKAQAMYEQIAAMGFNCVRYHLNSATLLTGDKKNPYSTAGWQRLDGHIKAAKLSNIKVIINMHFPPGGLQFGIGGMTLWTESAKQTQLVDLWTQIAMRYKNEPAVVGYGLVSEPKPVENDGVAAVKTWQNMVNKLVTAIRKKDKNHVLFVENVTNFVKDKSYLQNVLPTADNNYGFPAVKDSNYALEFHYYESFEFTHQAENLSPGIILPSIKYPNGTIMGVTGLKREKSSSSNQNIDMYSGESQHLETEYLYLGSGKNLYVSVGMGLYGASKDSELWIDSMWLEEYDSSWNYKGNLIEVKGNNPASFYLSGPGTWGQGSFIAGNGSAHFNNIPSAAVVMLQYNDTPIKPNHYYKLHVYARSAGFDYNAQIQPTIEMYSAQSYRQFDKQFLSDCIDKYIQYGKTLNIPMFVGEFGLSRHALPNGGYQYVQDMVELLKSKKLAFNFFAYDDDYFGIVGLYDDHHDYRLQALFKNIMKN